MNSSFSYSQPDSASSGDLPNQLLHELHCIGSLPSVLSQFTAMTGWSLSYHCVDSIPDFLQTPRISDSPVSLAGVSGTAALPEQLSPEILAEISAEEDLWIPIEIRSEFQKLKSFHSRKICEMTGSERAKACSDEHPEAGAANGSGSADGSGSAERLAKRDAAESGKAKANAAPNAKSAKTEGSFTSPSLDFLNFPIGFLHLSKRQKRETLQNPSAPEFSSENLFGSQSFSFGKGFSPSAPAGFQDARRLALAIGDLIAEMQVMRVHLWLLEMEAAANVPVLEQRHTRRNEMFAGRFRRLMEYARTALGFDAIGIYFFDGKNQVFKLRMSVGLPLDALTHSIRTLENAQADFRAYHSNHLIIQDASSYDVNFLIPEPFASGLCMPLRTEDSNFGTVWFFSNQDYFSEKTIHQAELLTEHFALSIERESFLRRHARSMEYRSELRAAADLQTVQSPILIPGKGNLDLYGWTHATRTVRNPIQQKKNASSLMEGEKSVSGDFYDWFTLPNGQTLVALGSVGIPGLSGAMLASAVRSALRSHASYDHSVSSLLAQVHRTLWLQLAADAKISLFCGILNPESSFMALHFASVGALRGIKVRGNGAYDFIPLTQSSKKHYLGGTSDFHCFEDSIYLSVGESFVLFNDGLKARSRHGGKVGGSFTASAVRHRAPTGSDVPAEKAEPIADSLFAPSRLNQVQSFSKLETIQHTINFELGRMLSDKKNPSARLLTLMVKNYFMQHVRNSENDQSVLTIQHQSAASKRSPIFDRLAAHSGGGAGTRKGSKKKNKPKTDD